MTPFAWGLAAYAVLVIVLYVRGVLRAPLDERED